MFKILNIGFYQQFHLTCSLKETKMSFLGITYFDLRKKALPDLSGIRITNSPLSLQNSSIAFFTPAQHLLE